MEPGASSSLRMPSFFHDSYRAVHQGSRAAGQRYGEQYRKTGSFSIPQEQLDVSSSDVVILHEAVDFQRERPAWRLYMVGSVADGLCEALDWQNSRQVGDSFEEFCRAEAWGALYFATAHEAPMSAARMARRLQAVLRSWDVLHPGRYLFSTPNVPFNLEALMSAACDWALEAWAPVGESSLRTRLAGVAERMERATREDSTEVILRQMPRALPFTRGLKHQSVLADPGFQRQRLSTMDEASFAPVSAAWPAMLIRQLHIWDRQLGNQ